jgi:NAD(P)-dependent dehydrogenase (short-subunit alcohol dehydrogenase family)
VRAELRAMRAASNGGSIVNVSSSAGKMGVPGLAAYSASKHGVIGLTKSAALEVARDGIRVNAVCPGTIRTPMLRGFVGGDEEMLEKMGRRAPIGRIGEPEEIAEAIVWLCSDVASFVTGHALEADGGVAAL